MIEVVFGDFNLGPNGDPENVISKTTVFILCKRIDEWVGEFLNRLLTGD